MALEKNQVPLHSAYQALLYAISMENRVAIGARIKAARKRAKLTQQQLADAVGVTAQAVSQWERDKTVPEASKFAALARALHASVDNLIGANRLSEVAGPRERGAADIEEVLRGIAKALGQPAPEPDASDRAALNSVWARLTPAQRKQAIRLLRALADDEHESDGPDRRLQELVKGVRGAGGKR